MNYFVMIGKQITRTVFIVSILFLGFGLSEKAFCKYGTVTINSPPNNNSVSSNFSVNIYAPLWWTDGVLNNGTYNSYLWSGDGCYYISIYPKLDSYWNGSKDVVGKLVYSIDGKTPVTVQDMHKDGGANFSIPVDISSLSKGSHSITVSTKDVYSTMAAPYYLNGSVSGSNCNSYYVNNCTVSNCHANPNGPWQRQDGTTLSSATHTFTVVDPLITASPNNLVPAHRTFVSPNRIFSDNVVFQWSAVPNANRYTLILFETNDAANTTRSYFPVTTSFDTASDGSLHLQRGRKYSWQVRGVNGSGNGPLSAVQQFIIGSEEECWPEKVETGNGQDHIDTCYVLNSNPEVYRLKDISRRTDMDVDGHKGAMSSPKAIISQVGSFTAGALTNNSNSWTAGDSQKKAIDAQVNSGKVYDYFYDPLLNPLLDRATTPRRFSRNSFDGIGGSMVNIVENSAVICGGNNSCFREADKSVNFDPGTTDSNAIDIVTHEWAHGITYTTSSLGKYGETGSLDEAFSDWMAITHKQVRGLARPWEVIEGGGTLLRNIADPTRSAIAQPVIYLKDDTWPDNYKTTPNWGARAKSTRTTACPTRCSISSPLAEVITK